MSITLRQRMHQDLQLAGLAEGTQKMYLRAVRQLATHVDKPPGRITESEVRDYLLYLKNERKYSPSSLKIAARGIVFFFTHTVPRDWVLFKNLHIPRPQSLPGFRGHRFRGHHRFRIPGTPYGIEAGRASGSARISCCFLAS